MNKRAFKKALEQTGNVKYIKRKYQKHYTKAITEITKHINDKNFVGYMDEVIEHFIKTKNKAGEQYGIDLCQSCKCVWVLMDKGEIDSQGNWLISQDDLQTFLFDFAW